VDSNAKADAVIQKINDLKAHVGTTNEHTKAEINERIDQVAEDAKHLVEVEMTKLRQESVGANSPVTPEQAFYMEQKGGMFGGKFRMPYKKMISLPPNEQLNGNETERLRTIHDLHDACVLRWYSLQSKTKPGQDSNWMWSEMAKTDDFKLYTNHLQSAGYMKAGGELMDPSATPGSYLDFTLLSSQLIGMVEEGAKVAPLFPKITLSRAKQDFPAFRGDTKAVLGGGVSPAIPQVDHSGITSNPYGTATAFLQPTLGNIGFDAEHCLGFLAYTDDQLEDSVVPILPMLREQAAVMISRAIDDAIINGDVTATHMDSSRTAPAFAKAWYGLRYAALADHSTDLTHSIASADFNTLMQGAPAISFTGGMGKYAADPSKLVCLLNVLDWLKLGVDATLLSVQNVGLDRAGIREGVVQIVHGIPIHLSEFVPRDLASTGVYSATPTHAVMILFRPDRWWLAQKNQIDIETVRVPAALGNWIQADVRVDFQPLDLDKGTFDFPDGVASPVEVGIIDI